MGDYSCYSFACLAFNTIFRSYFVRLWSAWYTRTSVCQRLCLKPRTSLIDRYRKTGGRCLCAERCRVWSEDTAFLCVAFPFSNKAQRQTAVIATDFSFTRRAYPLCEPCADSGRVLWTQGAHDPSTRAAHFSLSVLASLVKPVARSRCFDRNARIQTRSEWEREREKAKGDNRWRREKWMEGKLTILASG